VASPAPGRNVRGRLLQIDYILEKNNVNSVLMHACMHGWLLHMLLYFAGGGKYESMHSIIYIDPFFYTGSIDRVKL